MNKEKLMECYKNRIIECFKNHSATIVVDSDDVKILDWKEPCTINYWIRYVITASFLAIHGECGSGTFRFTWCPTFKDSWKLDMNYFLRNMNSSNVRSFTWCEEDALFDLDEYARGIKESDVLTNEERYKLNKVKLAISDSYDSYDRYIPKLYEYVDVDHVEKFENIGRRTHISQCLWLYGLQMASEQLNAATSIAQI